MLRWEQGPPGRWCLTASVIAAGRTLLCIVLYRKVNSLEKDRLLFVTSRRAFIEKKKKKCHIHRAFEGKLLVLISPLAYFQFLGKLVREQSCPCECMKATEQRKGSSSSPTPCLETTQPSQKQPQPEPCTQPWLLHGWEQSLFQGKTLRNQAHFITGCPVIHREQHVKVPILHAIHPFPRAPWDLSFPYKEAPEGLFWQSSPAQRFVLSLKPSWEARVMLWTRGRRAQRGRRGLNTTATSRCWARKGRKATSRGNHLHFDYIFHPNLLNLIICPITGHTVQVQASWRRTCIAKMFNSPWVYLKTSKNCHPNLFCTLNKNTGVRK